jgi:hypothetical protein
MTGSLRHRRMTPSTYLRKEGLNGMLSRIPPSSDCTARRTLFTKGTERRLRVCCTTWWTLGLSPAVPKRRKSFLTKTCTSTASSRRSHTLRSVPAKCSPCSKWPRKMCPSQKWRSPRWILAQSINSVPNSRKLWSIWSPESSSRKTQTKLSLKLISCSTKMRFSRKISSTRLLRLLRLRAKRVWKRSPKIRLSSPGSLRRS